MPADAVVEGAFFGAADPEVEAVFFAPAEVLEEGFFFTAETGFSIFSLAVDGFAAVFLTVFEVAGLGVPFTA